VTLQASAFSDPEGDSHVASHWKIARADRDIFGCSDYPLSFDSGPTGASLTQYTIPAEDLIPGMAYKWIVGYQDSGSSRFSWSQKNNAEPEPNENIFVVGYQETYTYPAIDSGLTADEFQMLSCHHIPDDPGASAVIGDDLAGGYDPGFYRIGPYDCEFNGGDYREYPGFTAHPGGAAWFLARNGLTVDITGVPLTITADVDVHLQYNPDNNNGWNMSGPPNNRNYRWNDVEVVVYEENGLIVFGPQRIGTLDSTNPYIDTRLWEWTNGAYANDTTIIMADDGYWVRAKQKNVNLRFTVGAQASLGNPDVLLAAGMDQIKRAGRGLVSPKAAMADEDSDSPPEPMDAVENDDDGGSSGGGNCFIGALNF